MVYGCGNNCVKYLVFFFNFLICIGGAVILGVSIWANLDGGFQATLQEQINKEGLSIPLSKYQAAIWVIAGVGGFLFLTGFLGCCGAACENRVLLGLFFIIVLILFLLELGAGIAAFAMKDQFKTDITTAINELSQKQGGAALQPIQDNLNCCGANGTGYNCPTGSAGTGCVDAVWNKITQNVTAAAAIAIAVLVIELLAMIFACVLCNAMRSGGYHYA